MLLALVGERCRSHFRKREGVRERLGGLIRDVTVAQSPTGQPAYVGFEAAAARGQGQAGRDKAVSWRVG